jgi:hypothetical protein
MAKEVAKTKNGNGTDLITDDMLSEMIANAGAGVSTASDDNILPFIVLLQDMNPEVKKRDPGYVEGAEAGMYMNRATKALYAGDADTATRTGKPQLEFQHCVLTKEIVEWIPRTEGGGFVARHELRGTVEDSMRKLGGRLVADPQDPNKSIWKTPDGRHDLVETRYHFGNIINDDQPQPAVIAFKSTGHTASKAWNTLMLGFKIIGRDGKPALDPVTGAILSMPAYFRRYIVGSTPKENNKGSFFVTTVTDGGVIRDAGIRAAGLTLLEGAKAGLIKASTDEDGGGSGRGGAEVSDEI